MREYVSIGTHVAYWLIILVLLVIAIASGSSQPPAPPGYSTNQTQSSNKYRSEQVKGEESKTFRQRATEDPVAFFTLWLVIFTGMLAFSTIGLWLVTGTAARAARDSADVLPKLERAYVFIEINPHIAESITQWISNILDPNEYPWTPKKPIYNIAVNYQIANHGKTPAIIKNIHATVERRSNVPEQIILRKPSGADIVLASGAIYPPRYEDYIGHPSPIQKQSTLPRYVYYQAVTRINGPFDPDDAKSVREGNSSLWFFGEIVYHDIFGNEWETRFCWRYNGLTNTFEQYDRPGENLNKRT